MDTYFRRRPLFPATLFGDDIEVLRAWVEEIVAPTSSLLHLTVGQGENGLTVSWDEGLGSEPVYVEGRPEDYLVQEGNWLYAFTPAVFDRLYEPSGLTDEAFNKLFGPTT